MNLSQKAQKVIDLYQMQPHIEGGYFRTFYEDDLMLPKDMFQDKMPRSCCNAIYFLIPGGTTTIFHQLTMNEIWHFCLGDPLDLYEIRPNKPLKKITLGSNLSKNHCLLYVFPRGSWFGSKSEKGNDFSLVTCTTAPGFIMSDWKKGKRDELLKLAPEARSIISELTDD